MRRAVTTSFGSLTTGRAGLNSYDQDKLMLGELMCQMTGSNPEDKWAGPFPVGIVRPMEASTAIPGVFPWVMRWSASATSEKDWVFLADNATAASTRRVVFMTYDRKTTTPSLVGFITVTFPGTSEAKTIRALRMKYAKRTTGTVEVSGTAVTGSGTAFNVGVDVGNRIGFGSTDPSAITTWYEVSAIGSATGITLTTSAGTISAGTPYVIEQLSCLLAITSTTATNGGLYMVKGLRPEIFTTVGSAIPAATTVDKIRACYHLADASTVTNTVSFGMGIEEEVDTSTHYLWVLDTIANPVLFKYNINAAMTLASGKGTNAFVFKTGAGGAVTGTTSQLNNGRVAQTSHGPGSGAKCIYFTTTTRVYRTAELSTITTGSTSWLLDNMVEIPPGGTSTFAATAALSSIEYSSVMDTFLLLSSGAAGVRSYLTKYNTTSSQLDRIILIDAKQIDQSGADSGTTAIPSQLAAAFSGWIEGGLLYLSRIGTTAAVNQVYVVPIGADWEYASTSNARLIFPRMATPEASNYSLVAVNEVQVIGGATGKNLGFGSEPYRLYYRTTGISDNSGSWNLVTNNGDLSGVAGANYIQFMAEFRVANTGIPARLQNLTVVYEDVGTLSNYQPSATFSDAANKRFAWYFKTAFGSSVPALRVRLYDADSGSELVDDNTTSPSGTFERSTNAGGAWTSWNNTDRANSTTYLRYTPAALADSIKVRAVLTTL